MTGKTPQQIRVRNPVSPAGPNQPGVKRRLDQNNKIQPGKNGHFMEQGGIYNAACLLAGNPLFGQTVYGRVYNPFQGGQFFRYAKNPLPQKTMSRPNNNEPSIQ